MQIYANIFVKIILSFVNTCDFAAMITSQYTWSVEHFYSKHTPSGRNQAQVPQIE